MEYTRLGRAGATVSRLGFGGAPIGLADYLDPFDPSAPGTATQVAAAVDAALASGINYYDTAPGYGNGISERLLGDALAGVEKAGDRPLFIASKVPPLMHEALGRGELRRSLEASLTRLRRDRLNLLQIHGDSYPPALADELLAGGGMIDQLQALVAEGLVGAIGFTSEDDNEAVYRFVRRGRFDTMQICYNLLFQHPYEPSRPFGCMLEADQAGMGVVTMRTATSGTLQRWIRAVNPADTFDYTPALIQFVLSNPYVDVALVGMRTAQQVRANVAIVDDAAGRIDLAALHERYVTGEPVAGEGPAAAEQEQS